MVFSSASKAVVWLGVTLGLFGVSGGLFGVSGGLILGGKIVEKI